MKQPKVYVKYLNKVFEAESIRFDTKVVEIYDEEASRYRYCDFDFDEVDFIYHIFQVIVNYYITCMDVITDHIFISAVVNKNVEEEFYYLEKNGNYCCRLSSIEDDYLVIGNIYENKDLLED